MNAKENWPCGTTHQSSERNSCAGVRSLLVTEVKRTSANVRDAVARHPVEGLVAHI